MFEQMNTQLDTQQEEGALPALKNLERNLEMNLINVDKYFIEAPQQFQQVQQAQQVLQPQQVKEPSQFIVKPDYLISRFNLPSKIFLNKDKKLVNHDYIKIRLRQDQNEFLLVVGLSFITNQVKSLDSNLPTIIENIEFFKYQLFSKSRQMVLDFMRNLSYSKNTVNLINCLKQLNDNPNLLEAFLNLVQEIVAEKSNKELGLKLRNSAILDEQDKDVISKLMNVDIGLFKFKDTQFIESIELINNYNVLYKFLCIDSNNHIYLTISKKYFQIEGTSSLQINELVKEAKENKGDQNIEAQVIVEQQNQPQDEFQEVKKKLFQDLNENPCQNQLQILEEKQVSLIFSSIMVELTQTLKHNSRFINSRYVMSKNKLNLKMKNGPKPSSQHEIQRACPTNNENLNPKMVPQQYQKVTPQKLPANPQRFGTPNMVPQIPGVVSHHRSNSNNQMKYKGITGQPNNIVNQGPNKFNSDFKRPGMILLV